VSHYAGERTDSGKSSGSRSDTKAKGKAELKRKVPETVLGIVSTARLGASSVITLCLCGYETFIHHRDIEKNRGPQRATAFIALLLVLATFVIICDSRSPASNAVAQAAPQVQMQFPEGLDYSKFQHSSRNHSRLPCLLCHRRDSNAPVPKRPGASGHLPCAGCHAQQFSNNESPICTICHTDVKSGALKPFPSRLISFRMKFDHAKHLAMGTVSCATCHRPAQGGVAMSIPADFNAHTTCYRCHSPRAQSGGRDISSCGTCHQLGGYSRTPQSAAAFKVSFSHAKHQKVTCTECHQVRAGMPQRRQITAPEPLNHHATGRGQSCMTCHDGKRAFGGEDFTVCKRCHTGPAWRF
jgi:c(7)-type cytochrome triheme protein